MNTETAQMLNDITAAFYRKQAESFSATRQSPWDGWVRCLDAAREGFSAADLSDRETAVLDLACGNLRFESFLESADPDRAYVFHAVDDCDELADEALSDESAPKGGMRNPVRYQSLDVIRILLAGGDLRSAIEAPTCDLVVSFGFMHHIPLASCREEVLSALVDRTRSGGTVAVSFWQFLNNEALAAKAYETHERAMAELGLPPLETGDFLLGWKNTPGAYRYCHNFDDSEIDRLIASVADRATVADRFLSDGRSGNLNAYLVLRVK